ncbi:hypothetical protein [Pinirhizobacter sp.]|uniref:hypothetical protein n=1 Tax=Pinirhizobacter sp. TaxID=2950432 RepID=UPI002F3FC40D
MTVPAIPTPNSLLRLLTPALFLAAGITFVVWTAMHGFTAMPGDVGDARFNNIILEHLYRWCTGADKSLWTPEFYYPVRGTLTFSDNHFGTGWFYILARLTGLSQYQAFDAWFLAGCIANFVSCHVVLRKLGYSVLGSAVGAFVFAFGLPASTQFGHVQLTFRFALPLALLAWHRFIDGGSLRQLGYAALYVCLTFYCAIYLGYFLVLVLAAWTLAALATASSLGVAFPHRRVLQAYAAASKYDRWLTIGLLTLSLALMWVLFRPYLHFAALYHFQRGAEEIVKMLPRAGSYLLADDSRVWSWLGRGLDVPARQEQQMFVGFLPLVLAALALLRATPATHRMSVLAASTLAVLVAFTLCIHGHSIYLWFVQAPGANAIRAVSRIILAMLLPVAMLCAGGIDALLLPRTGARRAWRFVLVAMLAVLTMGEAVAMRITSTPFTAHEARVKRVLSRLPAALPPNAVIFVPLESAPNWSWDLDGMAAGQALGRATLNGYSGNAPEGYAGTWTGDACGEAYTRIAAGVAINPDEVFSADALARRVVIAGAQCSVDELSKAAPRPSERDMAAARITLGAITLTPDSQLAVDATIVNHGAVTLTTNAPRTDPVRFSWQWVPLPGEPDKAGNWKTRQEIAASIPAGGAGTTTLHIPPPTAPGRYHLAVTLVQERVAWFKDAGMPLAVHATEVEVKAGAPLQLLGKYTHGTVPQQGGMIGHPSS